MVEEKFKILIADDDEFMREYYRHSLRLLGYELVECQDGNTAWATLQALQSPVIAFLDWNMPGLSGLELCKKLKETSPQLLHYLIVLTGRSSPEDLTDALNAGADDFLRKPVDRIDLQARIHVASVVLELKRELRQSP